MQVHSIISNTISEENLATGHLSIRFMTDGFCLLIEDKDYRPLILNRFSPDIAISVNSHLLSCEDWLNRHTLLKEFRGEITLVSDIFCSTSVPSELFSEENLYSYIQVLDNLKSSDSVQFRQPLNRPFVIVYNVPSAFIDFAKKFEGNVRIKPVSEILLSIADQVNAADHQRGFALVDVQPENISFLIIRNDSLLLLNHFEIRNREDSVYHILNTLKQVNFDRHNSPLFHSGTLSEKETENLGRYIRHIRPLSYHIHDLSGKDILEHAVLAEATKCV